MQKPPSVAKQGLVRIPNKPCLATGLCNRQSRLPVKMTAKYTSWLGDFKNIPCLATLFLCCDQPSWWIIIALFSWRCDHLGRKQFDQNPQLRHFFVDDSGTSKQTNEVRLLPSNRTSSRTIFFLKLSLSACLFQMSGAKVQLPLLHGEGAGQARQHATQEDCARRNGCHVRHLRKDLEKPGRLRNLYIFKIEPNFGATSKVLNALKIGLRLDPDSPRHSSRV